MTTMNSRFSKIEADLLLLKWMVGANVTLSVGILTKLLLT